MGLVANINGISVYSDKPGGIAVRNSRVTFADGSWCDVSTGQVHNVGPGYIRIGNTSVGDKTKIVTDGPKQFSAVALEVNNVTAKVNVDVHDGSQIEYTVTGPADQVEVINAKVSSNTLVIEGDSRNETTVVQSSNNSVVITGDYVMGSIISASNSFLGGGHDVATITVKVPKGTPVRVDNVLGDVTIGDTHGTLWAAVRGSSDMRVGHIGKADVRVHGSSSVRIKEVAGEVFADIKGSGTLKIRGGSMPSLVASVQGNGSVGISGTATTAELQVAGNGEIHVAHVRQSPNKHVRGNGRIRVDRVG